MSEEERENDLEEIETIPQQLEQYKTSYKPLSGDETRWMFDYRYLYWEIKASLMGGWITQDERTKTFVIVRPKDAVPEMNNTGIQITMNKINGFVSMIQALSYLDEERIHVLCKELMIKLGKLYAIEMENFELDPARAFIVIWMIMNLVETNLRKSISGNALRVLATTEKRVETIVEQPKRSGGILSHLPIIGKK